MLKVLFLTTCYVLILLWEDTGNLCITSIDSEAFKYIRGLVYRNYISCLKMALN